ncbi:MAG: hypothetical protein CVV55_00690 [Synergistetes bacterium HGW-Synergistetes-2]|nr:MAG: hypothetical protein CVV55_00690 [Synergistetes bacterium HGW-Synergistetes-2]
MISLCQMLSIPFGVVVNRWNLSEEMTSNIRAVCDEEGWSFLGAIPFAEKTARTVNEGHIPVKEIGEPLHDLWRAIVEKGRGI